MKRFLNVLLGIVIACGFAGVLFGSANQAEAATEYNPYNLDFELKLVDGADGNKEYQMVVNNLDDLPSPGAASISINYPSYLANNNLADLASGNSWKLITNLPTDPSEAMPKTISNSIMIPKGSEASKDQMIAFLNSLVFKPDFDTYAPGKVNISLETRRISEWVDENGTSHFYEYIYVAKGTTSEKKRSWTNAYNAAKASTYRGLHGYLATITSQEEQDFIFNSVATAPALLGGTWQTRGGAKINDPSSISSPKSSDTGKVWYWATGPEAGTVFYNTQTMNSSGPNDNYSNWAQGKGSDGVTYQEPNKGGSSPTSSTIESVLQFGYNIAGAGKWNNLKEDEENGNYNTGYYVEYSQYLAGDELQPPVDAALAAPIEVHYVDANGTEIRAIDTMIDTLGADYSVTAPKIAGYINPKLTADSAPETGTYSENKQVITYQYEESTINAVDALITESEAQALTSVDDVVKLNQAASTSGNMSNNVDLAAIKTKLGANEVSHSYPVQYKDETSQEVADVVVTVVKDGTVFPDVPAGEARPFGIYAQDASMMLEAANALADQTALDSGYTKEMVVLSDGSTDTATTDGTAYTTIHDATAAQVDGAPNKILVVPVAYTYTDGTYNAEKDVNVSISNGRLALVSAPTTLDFGTQKINSKRQYWATQNGNDLIVEDSRGSKAEWSLYVNQKTPIQSADNSLDGCLYYSDGTNNTLLSSADALVTAQSLAADVKEYDVSKTWGEGKAGLNLVVPNEKQQAGTYSGEVAWKLVDAPAANGTP